MTDQGISTQCSGYADLWAAHRDRAGPITPADVWGLREDREFQPPSRAHIKRIQRVRPIVTRAAPAPETLCEARLGLNRRMAMGRTVLAACGCLPAPHSPIPVDEAVAIVRRMTAR